MAAALNQALKWHGGKNYLARKIVALMPRHLTYCEPYFGGGAVLFARDPLDERLWLPPHKGVSEVVNDLNGDLTNFWRVLQHEGLFPEFVRACKATPFSGAEFERAREGLGIYTDSVGRAWAFFVLSRQSLAGRMKGFTGVTKTRTRSGMNNEVSAWLSAVEGLPAAHERLKRVLILKPQPAAKVVLDFDRPETLFYLDPPYLHETRATTGEYGMFEMAKEDHAALLDTLGRLEGKFMLSGYDSPLYDAHAKANGWNCRRFEVSNNASGSKEKRRMTECLWTNF